MGCTVSMDAGDHRQPESNYPNNKTVGHCTQLLLFSGCLVHKMADYFQ
ncbi:hypothetical protein [Kingella sp. (in: b-proteobacteria)]|nr:hypothetical protein [Kingella sp. (in: b-proteobacteria)]